MTVKKQKTKLFVSFFHVQHHFYFKHPLFPTIKKCPPPRQKRKQTKEHLSESVKFISPPTQLWMKKKKRKKKITERKEKNT